MAAMAAARSICEAPAVSILQQLVDYAVKPYRGASVGISIIEEHLGEQVFRWHALTGPLAPHRWATTPRDFSPCATVLERRTTQLMVLPERHFPYIAYIKPQVMEVLLVPFQVRGQVVGTIWIVSHDGRLRFDAGDVQDFEAWAGIASAAYERAPSIDSSKAGDRRADRLRATLVDDLSEPGPSMVGTAFLVKRMRAGDQRALKELQEVTYAKLKALARTILRNAEDAEEVVCETYAQAWRQAERYDPARATPMGWLVMVCRSRALDRLRRNRAPSSQSMEQIGQLHQEPLRTEELIHLYDEGSRVRQAVAKLSQERRIFVGLAFFEGLSTAEIASRTGVPLGTVKSHIRRAIAQLRRDFNAGPLSESESGG